MSEIKHSPEPWRVENRPFRIANDERVVKDALDLLVTMEDGAVDEADARRIVACVNACAGIPTEELERLGTHGLLKALNGLALIDAAGMFRALGRLP